MMVSIIIVNYNGKKYLTDCINSIESCAETPYEIIMVDNASTDESCAHIRTYHPNVKLVVNDKNLGFAGGNNLGALHATGELLLLLNNDTRLLTSLSPAVREFEEDTRIGVVGCRLLYENGTVQPSIGFEHLPLRLVLSWTGFSSFSFMPQIFKRAESNVKYYAYAKDAAWVSGAFLMTRRDLWLRLGGLDERYFMYIEDVDYCKRVRMTGYRVKFTPDVEIIHYGAAGRAWIGEKALEDSMQSYIVYFRKFYKRSLEFVTRSGLSMVMAMRACVYAAASLVLVSSVYKEKRSGFLKAAKILLGVRRIG